MKLFLSYTMRDGNVTPHHLRQASNSLLKFGPVFADAIHNADSDRQARVERELAECDLVVSIETKAFHESRWVTREREIASRLQKRTISVKWRMGEGWGSVLATIIARVGEHAVANKRLENYNIGRADASKCQIQFFR